MTHTQFSFYLVFISIIEHEISQQQQKNESNLILKRSWQKQQKLSLSMKNEMHSIQNKSSWNTPEVQFALPTSRVNPYSQTTIWRMTQTNGRHLRLGEKQVRYCSCSVRLPCCGCRNGNHSTKKHRATKKELNLVGMNFFTHGTHVPMHRVRLLWVDFCLSLIWFFHILPVYLV